MTTIKRAVISALIISTCLFAAAPARAAMSLEPGEWEDTETGTENGQPIEAEVTRDCMSAEEASDPAKALTAMKDAAGQCRKFDFQEKGNVLSIVMQCGDPAQMSIDMVATYTIVSPRHYTGTVKSTVSFAGRKTTSDKKIESKWIGACKK
jgi:hypothetical protein